MTALPPAPFQSTGSEAMSRAAEPGPPGASLAILTACEGRRARIECDGIVSDARIALGCLIRPEPGDHVLTGEAGGVVWVLSVLERPSGAPPVLWAEGDLTLAAGGDVSVMAAGTVNLDAGARVRAAAPAIDLHAGVARFVLDELTQIGRVLQWHVTKIRGVGEVLELFAGHVLTRARRVSSFVEETDQLRAGGIDHRAEGTLHLSARAAFVTADTVVRVDADQIHMG